MDEHMDEFTFLHFAVQRIESQGRREISKEYIFDLTRD